MCTISRGHACAPMRSSTFVSPAHNASNRSIRQAPYLAPRNSCPALRTDPLMPRHTVASLLHMALDAPTQLGEPATDRHLRGFLRQHCSLPQHTCFSVGLTTHSAPTHLGATVGVRQLRGYVSYAPHADDNLIHTLHQPTGGHQLWSASCVASGVSDCSARQGASTCAREVVGVNWARKRKAPSEPEAGHGTKSSIYVQL